MELPEDAPTNLQEGVFPLLKEVLVFLAGLKANFHPNSFSLKVPSDFREVEMKCQKYGFESPLEMNLGGNCGSELRSPGDLSGKTNQEWAPFEPNLPPLGRTIQAKKSKVEGKCREVTIMFCGLKDQGKKLSDKDQCYVQLYVMFYVHHWEGMKGIVSPTREDGILAVFGAVDELEDATQRAVNASIAMHKDTANFREKMKHDSHIPLLGIGIYTGTVEIITVEDYQVKLKTGVTINKAYKLAAFAKPGTTYVGEETHRLTRGLFSFQRMIGCWTGRMVGAGAGAATGAAIGARVGKSVGSGVIGGLLGALAGGVIGHYAYDKPKDEQTAKNLNFQFQPSQGDMIKEENGKRIQRDEQPISVYKVLSAKKDLSAYQSCKASMKTGDLLQWKGHALFMRLWRLFTSCKMNHSSMILRLEQYEKEKRRFITESRFHGTHLNLLSRRLEKYDGEVWWHPLKNEWDPHRQEIGEYVLKQIGIPFDLRGVARFTFKRFLKYTLRRLLGVKYREAFRNFKGCKTFVTWIDRYNEQKEVFCSEYCYWAYASPRNLPAELSDRLKLPVSVELPLPDDLKKLKIFDRKKQILKRRKEKVSVLPMSSAG